MRWGGRIITLDDAVCSDLRFFFFQSRTERQLGYSELKFPSPLLSFFFFFTIISVYNRGIMCSYAYMLLDYVMQEVT